MRTSDIDYIYSKLSHVISKEEFIKKVEDKVKEHAGLCDENMAALIVANELKESKTTNVNRKLCPLQSDYRNEDPFCWKEGCELWDSGAE